MSFVSGNGRVWLVRWLYAVAIGHLVIAIVMSWCAGLPVFADYHQQVAASFTGIEPAQLMGIQLWWFQLFGATLQAFALLMVLMVYLGNRYADPIIWLVLSCTMLWWAPQDIYISMQQSMWSHVWADLGALLVIVPAASWLAVIDRRCTP